MKEVALEWLLKDVYAGSGISHQYASYTWYWADGKMRAMLKLCSLTNYNGGTQTEGFLLKFHRVPEWALDKYFLCYTKCHCMFEA